MIMIMIHGDAAQNCNRICQLGGNLLILSRKIGSFGQIPIGVVLLNGKLAST
jgi:hypothetical protein